MQALLSLLTKQTFGSEKLMPNIPIGAEISWKLSGLVRCSYCSHFCDAEKLFLYIPQVRDLEDASKSIKILQLMIDKDIEVDCVRKGGSHTRNLLRMKRGLDMVRVLFEQILATDGNSLKSPASTAYAQVFAPHHGWAIRSAVAAGMYALTPKAQLLSKLDEDDELMAYAYSPSISV